MSSRREKGLKKVVHDGRRRPLQFGVYDAIPNKGFFRAVTA